MEMTLFIPLGVLLLLSVGIGLKILFGIRLKLYLVTDDLGPESDRLIPLTADLRKQSLFRTLRKKSWKEDIDLTLSDYQGTQLRLRINYHLWKGFSVSSQPLYQHSHLASKKGPENGYNENSDDIVPLFFLNNKVITLGRAHYLKSGMNLKVGDKDFKILITPAPLAEMIQENNSGQDRLFS